MQIRTGADEIDFINTVLSINLIQPSECFLPQWYELNFYVKFNFSMMAKPDHDLDPHGSTLIISLDPDTGLLLGK
jgi:hypothetical protein